MIAVRDREGSSTRLARLFRWAGALLFFSSLAYFLFAYVVTFGVIAREGRALPAALWNIGAFSVFALHHSLFARPPVRRWVARSFPVELERPFYVWVASVLFIAVCAFWRPVPGLAWQVEGVGRWALRLAQAAGVVLTLRSAAILDIRELAGLKPAATDAGEFRTTGPYGWVRHPIYAGWFLLVFAVETMTLTRLTFAAVSCAYLLIAMPLEERSLRAASPAYGRYMAQVRWRLVPRIY